MAEKDIKIIFANQLRRGIAVLCALVTHYVGIYWGSGEPLKLVLAIPGRR